MGAILSGEGGGDVAVPDFMTCDGHFELDMATRDADNLAAWCGWLRFEAHGSCVLRRQEDSMEETHAQWRVQDAETVRIVLGAGVPQQPAALLMRGVKPGTISLSIEGTDPSTGACYVFVAEDHDTHH
jgi:hypothetical protein